LGACENVSTVVENNKASTASALVQTPDVRRHSTTPPVTLTLMGNR